MPGHLLITPIRPRQERDKKGRFNKGNRVFKTAEKRNRFKRGDEPWNKELEFAEKIREKNGKPYWFIKYRGNWHQKHLWLWRQVNGNISDGFIIVFRNGDTLDCRIENLEEITRGELMKRIRDQNKINRGREVSALYDKYEIPRYKNIKHG